MLDIMTLEAQLLAEIKERQAKLDKIRAFSPKLQALEALLGECQSVCSEFGMTDLFSSLLGNFTAPATQKANTPTTSQSQVNLTTATNTTNTNSVLTDKETKAIRAEIKEFLEYEGHRLNDKTAKDLLIKKLEELNKQDLLAEVNLDDKENFLVEAKKLITLLTTSNNAREETKEEVKTPSTVVVTIPVLEESKVEEKLEQCHAPVQEIKEETLKSEDVLKSALVQNLVNGYYGTIEQDGVLNGGAMVRYPNTTELTPLVSLKLVSPAIFTHTPITPITPIEEIKEEVSIEEKEEEFKDVTSQEKMMWDALLAADFTPEELSAMSTDKETVDGYNSINGTDLTVLPIAELYEYTMGVGRIE